MFTAEQKMVIEERNQNILLLARAGSGKTYTVANKIANEVLLGVAPEDILCLTFTVKGAEELKEDVNKYCGKSGCDIFTIHAFCYYIIKEYLQKSRAQNDPHIADEVDVGEILSNQLKSLADDGLYTLSEGQPLIPERNLGKIMSTIKHKRDELGFSYSSEEGYGVTVNSLFSTSESFLSLFSVKKQGVKVTDYSLIDLLKKRGDEVCLQYQRILRASNLLDFDDLIFFAKELLKTNNYQKHAYKLIIVDEMQDTSKIEYQIVKEFFASSQLIMCGDPYQTIYTWRGSAPFEIMEDFKSSYNAKVVTLNGNRRSSKLLTYAGQAYLKDTFGVVIPLEETDLDGLEKIEVAKCYDSFDEARYVFDYIKNYQGDRSGLCVMARANRYIASLYKYFEQINSGLSKEERLSFFTADGDFQFFKKPVVKDFLSFLKLLVNPYDTPAFSKIAQKYIRGIGDGIISAIKDFGTYGISLGGFLVEDTYSYGDPYFSLISAYKSKNAVIYDLETTGLDQNQDQMIQISAIRLKDGKEFNRFVIPTVSISQKALETHGYGLEHIKAQGGKSAKEVLKDFAEFSKGCVLIGHNSSSFDDYILKRQVKEEGVKLEVVGYYDTLSLAQILLPNLKNYKLSTCCEFFGVVNERAHDAFSDVVATKGCFVGLMEDYIIPQTENRKRVVEGKKVKFESFYRNYLLMKEMLLEGKILALIKFIDESYGILKQNSRKSDRDSANDLYLAMKNIEESKDTLLALKVFLSDCALSGSQMDVIIKKYGKIPLITVHQSKGCEFDTVILVGADENELPSYGARQSGSEDEEKRIFYVALSRAKNKFVVTYPSKKVFGQNAYDRRPTPYLAKIPKKCIKEISTY